MIRLIRRSLVLIAVLVLSACSSEPVVPVADRTITPQQATTSQTAPGDSLLQWGGLIIESRNLRDATEIQILAYPLKEDGRPDIEASSTGRFIALHHGYLELEEYMVGRQVTATGRLSEIRKGMVADSSYLFPVLISDDIALWPETKPGQRPRIHFGFGASSGGSGYGGISISF